MERSQPLALLSNRLHSLAGILERAEAHWRETGQDCEAILEARLAPDMLPFPYQVLFACNQVAMFLDWHTAHGDSPRVPAESWQGVKDQVAAMIERIDQAQASGYAPPAEPRNIDLGEMGVLDLEPGQFFDDWVQPNFYFHFVTAYGLLRASGVPLGKGNYMSHLLPLLKQPA